MFNIPKEYQLIKEYDLKGISSKGYLLSHKKSGARISLIKNQDKNKVFYIGFRTTPTDSTGVAHIIEHSVLCGSKKYPLKDPFVELVKSSLNTFLNAMTYPDKTVYPVASENDKDFKNLMDVYMDAVLCPNIYTNEKIFLQEGWHYDLESPEDELTINGVVYNEMKGAFSSPDDVLERECLNSLFPDNTYAFESGGDPDNIPELTYEGFVAFHKRYYHPSNSYIYLYGDVDMEERLSYLDREYLSKYDKIDPNSCIDYQEPFKKPVEFTKEYPLPEGEDGETGVYFQKNFVTNDESDTLLDQAFTVLDYALLDSPGAPLRKELMAAGLGLDVIGGYSSGLLQTYFSVGVKGAKSDDKEKFLEIVDRVLKEQVEKGIDKQALLAAINIQEFSFRESDFGSYPKGLVYGLSCLDSWLYEDMAPFSHLNALEDLALLKEKVETDYFEKLVEQYLLNNPHSSMVTLVPSQGLAVKRQQELKKRLLAIKEKMSPEEIEGIIQTCKDLKEYQEQVSTPEQIATLPSLKREDLDKNTKPIHNREEAVKGIKFVYHDVESYGINYLSLMFDIGDLPKELVPAASLMIRMMGLLDTKNYSYSEFSNVVNIKTGGLYSTLSKMTDAKDRLLFHAVVGVKFLEDMTKEAISLLGEMILETKYEDTQRMKEIINQEISNFKMRFSSSGHIVAYTRALARASQESYISELTGGIEFYEYLKSIDADFDNQIEIFKEQTKKLRKLLFRKSSLIVSSTGKKELTKKIEEPIVSLYEGLSDEDQKTPTDYGLLDNGNEAFKTAAAIVYVSRAGNYKALGGEFSGALRVIKTILSYEYFWTNIRVLGGAYGCMSLFQTSGNVGFVSYRDPNLKSTIEVFDGTPDYISKFDISEEELTRYVIGTVSSMDTPLTPFSDGERSMSHYLMKYTLSYIQEKRDEVLNVKVSDIKKMALLIEKAMSYGYLCVVGNESIIDSEKERFDSVKVLA